MRTQIFLREIKPENLLAEVDLEVVPRGIYVIDDVPYQYTGQPTFTLKKCPEFHKIYDLWITELVVEPVK